MMQLGCDGPDGTGSVTATTTIADGSGEVLVPPEDVTSSEGDTALATTATDASAPDVTASVCAAGCLSATPTSGAVVSFAQLPRTIPPPHLAGGSAPTGDWRLSQVRIFPFGTFADGVDVTISNEGNTRGRALFDGDAMAIELFLDLRITVTIDDQTGDGTGQSSVTIGGCHSVSAGKLVGQLTSCATGWPSGTTPPSTIAYELGDDLELAIELEPEFLIAMLPEDQQQYGAFVIVGPLTLVATMSHP